MVAIAATFILAPSLNFLHLVEEHPYKSLRVGDYVTFKMSARLVDPTDAKSQMKPITRDGGTITMTVKSVRRRAEGSLPN